MKNSSVASTAQAHNPATAVTLIDIDAIEIPEKRLRALQPDKVNEIAASMRDVGQLQAIVVRLRPGGFHIKRYLLVFGLHRIEAAKKTGAKAIIAVVADMDTDAAELAEIDENAARADLSPAERKELAAKRIARVLKATPQKSNRQIAKETKTSHPHVAKFRKKLERTGDVETVSTSTDTKGRKQPAHKPPTKDPAVTAAVERAVARSEENKRRQAAGNAFDPQESAAARKAEAAKAEPAQDEPEPGSYRVAFCLRADAARKFAFHSGPDNEIDEDCCKLAEEAAAAWTDLARRLRRIKQSPTTNRTKKPMAEPATPAAPSIPPADPLDIPVKFRRRPPAAPAEPIDPTTKH